MRRPTPNELRELLEFSTLNALVADFEEDAKNADDDCPAFDLEFLEALEVGAITPEERREFTRRLAECPRCAAQIALQIKHGGLFAENEEDEEDEEENEANGLGFETILGADFTAKRSAPEIDAPTRTKKNAFKRERKPFMRSLEYVMVVLVAALGVVGFYQITKDSVSQVDKSVLKMAAAPDDGELAFRISDDDERQQATTVQDDALLNRWSTPVLGPNGVGNGGLTPRNFGSKDVDAPDGDAERERLEEARRKIAELRGDANDGSERVYSAKLTDFGYRPDGTKKDANAFDKKKFEEIADAYEDAIRIAPFDDDLRLEFAWFLVENFNGDATVLRRAKRHFRRAAKGVESELALGVCAFLEGDDAAVQERFKKALNNDPENETARTNLAISVARAGRGDAETEIAKPDRKRPDAVGSPAINGAAAPGPTGIPF